MYYNTIGEIQIPKYRYCMCVLLYNHIFMLLNFCNSRSMSTIRSIEFLIRVILISHINYMQHCY